MAKKLYKISNSKIHQSGLFANASIGKGDKIIQYTGEKISKNESEKRALSWEKKAKKSGEGLVYIFELNDKWDLDGLVGENPARLINHSCSGNCEAINVDGEIWIFAKKKIKEGEELTYDYGYDMEHFLDHPCRCGSKNCVGYIVREDQRLKVRQLLKKRKKKKVGASGKK